jgi:hypothetical protein
MRFFESQGRPKLAVVMNKFCATWCVPGPSPKEHGAEMMRCLAENHPNGKERPESDRYQTGKKGSRS